MQTQSYVDEYYADNGKKLRKVVDKILLSFGGITDPEHFYSLANEVFTNVIKSYNGTTSFDGYFYTCMKNRVASEMTKINAKKRSANKNTVSLHEVVDENENLTLEDMIADDTNIENEVLNGLNCNFSNEMVDYLKSLSLEQRKILGLLCEGYKPSEIREEMGLDEKTYNNLVADFRSYSKVRDLIGRNSSTSNENNSDKGGITLQEVGATSEKSKNDNFTIEKIDREMRKHRLRDDHPLQRSMGQWPLLTKSEFISDILQGLSFTQVIVSEEIKDGVRQQWLIDGKQRCTTASEFMHDGFAISRNVSKWDIEYETTKCDENGNEIFNEEGFPIPITNTFDIRGKKFSKLPIELQDRFREYNFPVMLNLGCTNRKIAYDIARFNRCRPMNTAQNGWTGMDENFAELVDKILQTPFFKPDCPNSSYTSTSNRNGALRRMVVESIVLSDFPDEVHRDFRKMCHVLTENANDDTFAKFYDNVERINKVATPETAELFNIKNSFIWFAVFDAFTEFGLEDSKFSDFLKDFKKELHSKEINGVSYDTLEEDSATKDRNKVIRKHDFLVELMKDYFKIGRENSNVGMKTWFISDAVGISEEVVKDNIDLYEQSLDDLEDRYMSPTSKLREPQNRMSLLALMAYMYEHDADLDSWFAQYVGKNAYYVQNPKQNYLSMIRDYEKYIVPNQIAS